MKRETFGRISDKGLCNYIYIDIDYLLKYYEDRITKKEKNKWNTGKHKHVLSSSVTIRL
jgi:hypothetical protein